MPLPIGHALAGIAFQQARPGFFFKNRWGDALFFMFLANLPDLDFLPGIILGRPNLYHHGVFHSLGAGLGVALAGAGLFYLKRRRVDARPSGRFWASAAMISLVFYSHLLLDFFACDFVAPFGLPLFWPFSGRYFISATPIFLNITRSAEAGDFFISIFNQHNLGAALREIIIIGGLALGTALFQRHAAKKRSRE